MTFHPFVLAYGQRRGYAMADLHSFTRDSSSLFSSNSAAEEQPINVSLATDLMFNLADPSAYLNELQLFASFSNSFLAKTRRSLRFHFDGATAYFVQQLSRFGHPPDVLSAAIGEWEMTGNTEAGNVKDRDDNQADNNRLLKKFLCDFPLPLLNEYFQQETSIFQPDGNEEVCSASVKSVEKEEEPESESEEAGVEDPHWWTPNVSVSTPIDEEDPTKPVEELESIVSEILDICAKLPRDDNLEFPFAMKMYNFSSKQVGTRLRIQKSTVTCADITSGGRLACFGCDGDSKIMCFPTRRNDISSRPDRSLESSPFSLPASSSSGIVYRMGLLETSSDGSFLLSTSGDESRPVRLFDLASREAIYDYRGHQWPVWAFDVMQVGGGMFLTGSYDRTARLFLLDRRDPIRVFVGHESSVDCVRFISSPRDPGADDTAAEYPPFIATASSDCTVRLWSLTDAISIRVFYGMKGWPTALAFRSASVAPSPEKLLACATTEGKIFVWELESGRSYQVLEGVLANDLQFSPDGQYLVAGGDHGCFKIYRLSMGTGDFGGQYVEMQISENLLFHNIEAKFLKIKFLGDELVCLTA